MNDLPKIIIKLWITYLSVLFIGSFCQHWLKICCSVELTSCVIYSINTCSCSVYFSSSLFSVKCTHQTLQNELTKYQCEWKKKVRITFDARLTLTFDLTLLGIKGIPVQTKNHASPLGLDIELLNSPMRRIWDPFRAQKVNFNSIALCIALFNHQSIQKELSHDRFGWDQFV